MNASLIVTDFPLHIMAPTIFPPETEKLLPRLPPVDFNTTFDPSTLEGRSVLITGGASGIGLCCAKAIASHGALVTILDKQRKAGEVAARAITAAGHKAQFVECDVTSYQAQCAAFRSAIDFGGGSIDIVILSAAVMCEGNLLDSAAKSKPSTDTPPPEPGLVNLDVNLKGAYYSTYLALHYFQLPTTSNLPAFKRAIVLFGSVAGYVGYPLDTTYSVSKFALRGLLTSIRDSDPEQRVRINLVAPWYVNTPLNYGENTPPGVKEHAALFKHVPVEAVAEVVVRFSADERVSGRSAFVLPLGAIDLGDDIWGGFGGAIM